jgi:RNase P/RNase MRP subunit POP5
VSINLPENEISLERTRSAAATAEVGLASGVTPQRRSVEKVLREADTGAFGGVGAAGGGVGVVGEEARAVGVIGTRRGEEREM